VLFSKKEKLSASRAKLPQKNVWRNTFLLKQDFLSRSWKGEEKGIKIGFICYIARLDYQTVKASTSLIIYLPFGMKRLRSMVIVALLLVTSTATALSTNPERNYRIKPEKLGIAYREISIQTPDKAQLTAWIFEPQGKPLEITIILAGGDSGNMGYLLPYIDGLRKQGFRVVSFDYRGFGTSSEFPTSREVLYYDEFTTDVVTVINKVKALFPAQSLGIMGFSMGTIMAFQAANKGLVSFVIADSPVVNVAKVTSRLATKGKITRYPSSGRNFDNMVRQMNFPLLTIVGKKDFVTTLEDVKTFLKKDSRLLTIEHEGGHLEGVKSSTSYFDDIQNFVRQLWKQTSK